MYDSCAGGRTCVGMYSRYSTIARAHVVESLGTNDKVGCFNPGNGRTKSNIRMHGCPLQSWLHSGYRWLLRG